MRDRGFRKYAVRVAVPEGWGAGGGERGVLTVHVEIEK